MREVERANQRDMETLPQRDLEPAEQRAYPSQSSINYVVRGERVTFIVTSGVLTAGIFGTFVATRDPWILVIGVVWPFLFPFFHAMGLALLERVTPLMIDKMVSDWEAQLREAPRVGDRVLVWYGISIERARSLVACLVSTTPAPTCHCCWPAPAMPRCGPWSAMPARARTQLPATSPRTIQHAASRRRLGRLPIWRFGLRGNTAPARSLYR
jgi:hypothetical protein